jgi:hypothetical protein
MLDIRDAACIGKPGPSAGRARRGRQALWWEGQPHLRDGRGLHCPPGKVEERTRSGPFLFGLDVPVPSRAGRKCPSRVAFCLPGCIVSPEFRTESVMDFSSVYQQNRVPEGWNCRRGRVDLKFLLVRCLALGPSLPTASEILCSISQRSTFSEGMGSHRRWMIVSDPPGPLSRVMG